jgi:hypothetical protein
MIPVARTTEQRGHPPCSPDRRFARQMGFRFFVRMSRARAVGERNEKSVGLPYGCSASRPDRTVITEGEGAGQVEA